MPLLKFLWFAIRPISKATDVLEWWHLLNIILLYYFAPLTPLLSLGDIKIDNIIWFVGIPALLFLIAGIKLQYRVNNYEKLALRFVVNDDNNRRTPEMMNNRITDIRKLYFIGVETIGQKTINDVEISLKEIRPDFLLNGGAVPLNPKDASQNTSSKFSLNPGIVTFVELFDWMKSENDMGLHFYPNYHNPIRTIPSTLQMMPYKLTIIATGKDIGSVEGKLSINIDRDGVPELFLEDYDLKRNKQDGIV
jgi:hypothetical protein